MKRISFMPPLVTDSGTGTNEERTFTVNQSEISIGNTGPKSRAECERRRRGWIDPGKSAA
jgi:hypothetical protein